MATNTTKKSLNLEAKNVKVFINWLKKFSSINVSLLLEIDEKQSKFIAKTYNDERSVVKMSQINIDEAGFITKVTKEPKRIKVGIYNIPRLIKVIDQFNEAEFEISINYDEIINDDNVIQYAAETIVLKNKSLKITVDCTSLNIFKYISDELFVNTISKIESLGNFELSRTNIEKINSLCSLDNENKFMEFKFSNNKIIASGKTFEYVIEERTGLPEISLNIFKEQYGNLDVENYFVELGSDRLVFKAKDSNTVSVISMAVNEE